MTTEQELRSHLQSRLAFKPGDWIQQLDSRKREEIDFHNFERTTDDAAIQRAQEAQNVHANRKYYSVSGASQAYVEQWLRTHVPDRVFLDYACGNGERAVQAAYMGARLCVGLDISDVSVSNARRAAEAAGVADRCLFIQGDCEATELPNESIDVVLCSGMLHHLDLSRAYPELARILRPSGRLLGVEALGHNPVIQLYRDLTPKLRTEWEAKHILKMKDVQMGERYFQRGETRFWHLFSLGAVPLRRTPLFRGSLAFAEALDTIALRIPGIQLMAWQVTFELLKAPARS